MSIANAEHRVRNFFTDYSLCLSENPLLIGMEIRAAPTKIVTQSQVVSALMALWFCKRRWEFITGYALYKMRDGVGQEYSREEGAEIELPDHVYSFA
jgi:hypothetical protein